MTQVNCAVGVGQGAGHQYSSFLFTHSIVRVAGFRASDGIGNYGMTLGQAVAPGEQFSEWILQRLIWQSA
jgi:hypothetical protein